MSRPVTLFTGQWADKPLEELCKMAGEFGYDGLELACWGDHFEVDKALSDDGYCARKRELLDRHDLKLFAISNHLVGQAVLDNIDMRHQILVFGFCRGVEASSQMHREQQIQIPDSIVVICLIYYSACTANIIVWDTMGQERFKDISYSALSSLYYRETAGVILTYDTTCADSFRNMAEWNRELRHVFLNIFDRFSYFVPCNYFCFCRFVDY